VRNLARWWHLCAAKRAVVVGAVWVAIALIGDRIHVLHGQFWIVPVTVASLLAFVVGVPTKYRDTPHVR
jgi:hypothetical protein